MPYFKGQSGNPGGRPKDSKWVKDLARRKTPEAIRALSEALDATRPIVSAKGDIVGEEPDHRVRCLAANALLDRAYGKPAQEITGADGGAVLISAIDESRRLEELRARYPELLALPGHGEHEDA